MVPPRGRDGIRRLSHHRPKHPREGKQTKMKSAKQIYKEVKSLATEQEQQKYIDALTEKETIEFANFLLRFP